MIEEFKNWCKLLEEVRLPRWDELPALDLYMDQVVTLIDSYLEVFFVDKQEKKLTKAMVNNYVKLQMIPPPTKKLYSRRHVAFLIAITVCKRTYEIKDVNEGILEQAKYEGEKAAYNKFCDEMEIALQNVCKQVNGIMVENSVFKEEERMIKIATQGIASKLMVEKLLTIQKKERLK